MSHSCGLCVGDEFQAEFFGANGQAVQDPLAIFFLKIFLALVGVSRASLWAAAVTALGLSMREHMRLKYAPSADWLVRNAAAASRKAWAARLAQRLVLPLITLPPVILVGSV